MYSLSTASVIILCLFFFFNDTATTEIYTLSLHDALPIFRVAQELRPDVMLLDISLPGDGLEAAASIARTVPGVRTVMLTASERDRKSTRLNSSHVRISYAVFCLKKKKERAAGRSLHGISH